MNENGTSPVIGVILMVAITVILAAVIAAFVFGMSGTAYIERGENGLVECSQLYQVADKYQTPTHNYIRFSGRTYHYSYGIESYNNVKVGDYVQSDLWGNLYPIQVQQLSENETGYRDACRIIEHCMNTCPVPTLTERKCSSFTSKKCQE